MFWTPIPPCVIMIIKGLTPLKWLRNMWTETETFDIDNEFLDLVVTLTCILQSIGKDLAKVNVFDRQGMVMNEINTIQIATIFNLYRNIHF